LTSCSVFLNPAPPPATYIRSLHDALPILGQAQPASNGISVTGPVGNEWPVVGGNLGNGRYSSLDQINTTNVQNLKAAWMIHLGSDRKSTRLNSSHGSISYAVFCLKKKNQ